MIGYGNKSLFQFGSKLIYDQTSIIAGASRKVGEQFAHHQPLRGIGGKRKAQD